MADMGKLELQIKTDAGTVWFEYNKNTFELSLGIEHTGVTLDEKQTSTLLRWLGVPNA